MGGKSGQAPSEKVNQKTKKPVSKPERGFPGPRKMAIHGEPTATGHNGTTGYTQLQHYARENATSYVPD